RQEEPLALADIGRVLARLAILALDALPALRLKDLRRLQRFHGAENARNAAEPFWNRRDEPVPLIVAAQIQVPARSILGGEQKVPLAPAQIADVQLDIRAVPHADVEELAVFIRANIERKCLIAVSANDAIQFVQAQPSAHACESCSQHLCVHGPILYYRGHHW